MFGVPTAASTPSNVATLPRLMRTECDAQHTAGASPIGLGCAWRYRKTVQAAESAYLELASDDAGGDVSDEPRVARRRRRRHYVDGPPPNRSAVKLTRRAVRRIDRPPHSSFGPRNDLDSQSKHATRVAG